jgi:hypothetical protein
MLRFGSVDTLYDTPEPFRHLKTVQRKDARYRDAITMHPALGGAVLTATVALSLCFRARIAAHRPDRV